MAATMYQQMMDTNVRQAELLREAEQERLAKTAQGKTTSRASSKSRLSIRAALAALRPAEMEPREAAR